MQQLITTMIIFFAVSSNDKMSKIYRNVQTDIANYQIQAYQLIRKYKELEKKHINPINREKYNINTKVNAEYYNLVQSKEGTGKFLGLYPSLKEIEYKLRRIH